MKIGLTFIQRVWIILALIIPATLGNLVLALLRTKGYYHTLAGEVLYWWKGIDIMGLPRIIIFDSYFALIEIMIVSFSLIFGCYKERRLTRGLKFKWRWMIMGLLIVVEIFIFTLFYHTPNARIVTDFFNSTNNSSILSQMILTYTTNDYFVKIFQFFCIVALNGAVLGGVAAPVYLYDQIRTNILSSRSFRNKLKCFLSFLPSVVLRFFLVGLIVATLYFAIVFPSLDVQRYQLQDITQETIARYSKSELLPHNLFAIALFIWLFSSVYYLTTSPLKINVVSRYIWETQKANLSITFVFMAAFFLLSARSAQFWLPFISACMGASVLFHRILINSFQHFETLSEKYLSCTIRKILSGSRDHIVVVGGDRVGRAILHDLIPFERVEQKKDKSFDVWRGGPWIERRDRGRSVLSFIVHGVIVIDKSDTAIHLLGSYPPIGSYGYIAFPIKVKEEEKTGEVIVPAIIAGVGEGRTPTPSLQGSKVVVITVEDPTVPVSLLSEITSASLALDRSARPAMVTRMNSASELFQMLQSGEEKGVSVIPIYFEREIGYHLGLALTMSNGTTTASKSNYDYLFICDGKKRIYHVLETLFLHGKLKIQEQEKYDESPLLRACIVTSSEHFIKLCEFKMVDSRELLVYNVTWTLNGTITHRSIPVKYQQKNYSLISRLINEEPLKGIFISEGSEHDNLSAIANVSSALDTRSIQCNISNPIVVVVISANSELDLIGAQTFLGNNVPNYCIVWTDFVAKHVNSILHTLRAGPEKLHVDDLNPDQIRKAIKHPAPDIRHRLYCPTAAFMKWVPLSDSEEPGLHLHRITPSALAAYLCVPDQIGMIYNICNIMTRRQPLQATTPDSIDHKKRNYSFLTICFDEEPGSLSKIIESLLVVDGEEQITPDDEVNINFSHSSTFDCGLDNRMCMRIFAHRPFEVKSSRSQRRISDLPLRVVAILAPETEIQSWKAILGKILGSQVLSEEQESSNSRSYDVAKKELSDGFSLLVAHASELNSNLECITSCQDRSCLIRNYCLDDDGTLWLRDKVTASEWVDDRSLPMINLNFLQACICSISSLSEPISRLTAFMSLDIRTKEEFQTESE